MLAGTEKLQSLAAWPGGKKTQHHVWTNVLLLFPSKKHQNSRRELSTHLGRIKKNQNQGQSIHTLTSKGGLSSRRVCEGPKGCLTEPAIQTHQRIDGSKLDFFPSLGRSECPRRPRLKGFLVICLVWTKLGQPWDYSKLLREGSTSSNRHPNTCFSC